MLFIPSLARTVFAAGSMATISPAYSPVEIVALAPVQDSGTTVPMTHMDEGKPAVAVLLNGHGPFLMMIETGMTTSSISPRILQAAGLAGPGFSKTVDSACIGSVRLRNLPVEVRETGYDSIVGTLPLDAFPSLLVTLDYPRRLVQLSHDSLPPANGRDILPLRDVNPGGYVGFDLIVAGRRVHSFLDTQGGAGFVIPPILLDSTPLLGSPVVTGSAEGPAIGLQDLRTGRVNGDIQVGPITFTRPIIDVIPMPVGAIEQVWHVGTRVLRELVVTIDLQHHRIQLSSPKARIDSPPRRGVGLMLAGSQAGIVVSRVLAYSAAEEQGIRTGDLVLTIDTKLPWEVDLAQLMEGERSFPMEIQRDGKTWTVTMIPKIVVP